MKAALAMYSNQNQPVIVSSKRTANNTNATAATAATTNESKESNTSLNPFPVDHITNAKLMSNSNLSTGIFTYVYIFKKKSKYMVRLLNLA